LLKILHVSDNFPGLHDSCGGAEIIAGRIVELFATCGWRQALLVAQRPSVGIDNNRDRLEVFVTDTLEGLMPQESWLTALKGQLLPYDPLVFRTFADVLNSYRPDVVLLHNVRKLSLSVAEICKLSGTPVFAMVYDYIHFCPAGMFVDHNNQLCREPGTKCLTCHQAQATKLRPWSQKLLPHKEIFFQPLIDSINSFIALSQASKDLLVSIGISKDKINVIEQPLLQRPTGQERTADPNHILFVGWGQHRKGLLVVAQALKYVTKPFSFEAIGELVDKDYVNKVRIALESAGLDPDICLRGRVSDEDLVEARNRAGVVVIAEQWENMSPAVLHESMLAGKVVVAGAIGGIPEFIEDGKSGLLARYDDPVDFAAKLDAVLGDEQKQRRIGLNAIKAAQEHTNPARILSKYRSLFHACAGARPDRKLKTWLKGGSCIIICGGKGTRLGSIKKNLPKSLVPIDGKPIIEHILEFWAPYVKKFILVLGKETFAIAKHCESLSYAVTPIIERSEGAGVAAALLEAQQHVSGRFVVVLGDCLYRGPIRFQENMDRGVGVYPQATPRQIKENFSVSLKSDAQVGTLIEKPADTKNTLCGMGVYFLDGALWRAIRETPPDKNNKIQITSVLQTLADTVGLFPVFFEGGYVNVNYPEDLVKAEELLKKRGEI